MAYRREIRWRLPVVLLAGGFVACAAGPRAGVPDAAADPCAVGTDSGFQPSGGGTGEAYAVEVDGAPPGSGYEARPPRPIVVALPGPVDPANAPVPRTNSERLVFAQLYETVVRVTCEGRVEPALADSWRADAEGRRWRFTLRADIRDWDGAPVTAADVGASWLHAAQSLAREPHLAPPPGLRRVAVEDGRTLVVELDGPASIGLFAHPAFSVRTGAGPRGWPIGTGRLRLPGSADPASGHEVDAGPPLSLVGTAASTALELRVASGDLRNQLDAGIDLLVTHDPEVIEYAVAGPFHATPLAWDRSYLLAVPGWNEASGEPDPHRAADRSDRAEGPIVVVPPPDAVADLGRDAIGASARPAAGLAEALEACVAGSSGAYQSARAQGEGRARTQPTADRALRIVYPVGDAAARALAERLVALALDPERRDALWLAESLPALVRPEGRVRATGMASTDFVAALRSGEHAAYLVAIDRSVAAPPCEPLGALLARAPWLAAPKDGDALSPSGGATAPAILPLVDTRSTLLLRHGVGGIVLDGRGTLRLEGVRWRTGETRERP